jgi:hypothetical protein
MEDKDRDDVMARLLTVRRDEKYDAFQDRKDQKSCVWEKSDR